jgi:hypothetical protein
MVNLLVSLLAISLVSDWIERKAHRLNDGQMMPPFRWIAWGWRDYGSPHQVWFLYVKLPSYEWDHCDFGAYWCWHQRVLVYDGARGLRLELLPTEKKT